MKGSIQRMANVHDYAYRLEKAIRESDEYKTLTEIHADILNDEVANRMFTNFRELQLELQTKQMQGIEITEADAEKAQKQMELVQQHDKIAKLLQAEQRLSIMFEDINKIIAKPLEEVYAQNENN